MWLLHEFLRTAVLFFFSKCSCWEDGRSWGFFSYCRSCHRYLYLSPWKWLNATPFVWLFSEDISEILARVEDFYHLLWRIISWQWCSLWKLQLSTFICRSHSIMTPDVFLPFLSLKRHLTLIRCSCEILMLSGRKIQQHMSRKQAKTISDVAPLTHHCMFMNSGFSLTLMKSWRSLRVKSFQILPNLKQISKNARYVQYCIKILGLLLCPATH